jgi:CheY-like chemotaxis protein
MNRPPVVTSHEGEASRRARILVVDDEEVLGRTLKRALSHDNDVTALTSPSEALERILSGERFDVIVCDLLMHEMSGMELYRALAQWAPQQAERMVFLTGGASTPQVRSFVEERRHLVLLKPFDSDELRRVVRRMAAP